MKFTQKNPKKVQTHNLLSFLCICPFLSTQETIHLAPFFCKNPCSKLPICRLLWTIVLHHAPSSAASLINIHIGRNLHRILVAKNKKRHFHTFHEANRAPKSIVTQQEPHHDIAPTSSWRTKEQHSWWLSQSSDYCKKP